MTDLTYENAIRAMRKAHDAGNFDDAKRLAKLAKSLEGKSDSPDFMGQVNRSIGRAIDLVNPFDKPHALNPFPEGTGQAGDAMRKLGIRVADDEPEGFIEGFASGLGDAASALVPGGAAIRGISTAAKSPLVRGVADDAFRAMATRRGATAELTAGGLSGGAMQVAEDQSAPPWAQVAAGMTAPLGIPAALGAGRAAFNVASKAPMVGGLLRSLTPTTEAGARRIAQEHLQGLAGGRDRAGRLAEDLGQTELGLTPAQQTADPNLLGLERAAAMEDPNLREALAGRAAAGRQGAEDIVGGLGGDVSEARGFFNERLREFRASMDERAKAALTRAGDDMDSVPSGVAPEVSSERAVDALKAELAAARAKEKEMWGIIAKDVKVRPVNARQTAEFWKNELGPVGRDNIPNKVNSWLLGNGFGEEATVRDMHQLYSDLRQVARNQSAGTNRNDTMATVANKVADAILDDIKASSSSKEITEALAYSRALHETFDQGSVGRILKRTQSGDTEIPAEAALAKTVGRGGADGMTAARKITQAAPGAGQDIDDFLRNGFMEAAFSPQGEYTGARAASWMRKNRETLQEFPRLKAELETALLNKDRAVSFAVRANARAKLAESGPVGKFAGGRADKAVYTILGADDPAKTARSIVVAARKDKTGATLDGVKGAFAEYLMEQARPGGVLSGDKLQSLLKDKRTSLALQQVLSPDELGRLRRVSSELRKIDIAEKAGALPSVIDTPANRMLDMVVRVFAAQKGGQMGASSNMGGSLQTANIFAANAQKMLRHLTNARAREILTDSITDADLFKDLLTGVDTVNIETSRIAPYLAGGAAGILGNLTEQGETP